MGEEDGMFQVAKAKMVKLIEVTQTVGSNGDKHNPLRTVRVYYNEGGDEVAISDPARCEFCGTVNCQSDHA